MSGQDHSIPNCASCGHPTQRNDRGEWFCLDCADDWLGKFVKTEGQTPSFRQLMPNRAMRRRMAR